MKKTILYVPLITVLVGAACFFLRERELATVFDEKGLAVSGAAVTVLLCAAVILAAVGIAVYAFMLVRTHLPRSGVSAFAGNTAYAVIGIVSGAGCVYGGLQFMTDGLLLGLPTIARGVFFLLAALAGTAFAVSPILSKKGKSSAELTFLSVVPPVFFCLWLVILYRDCAREPQLTVFVYECLALMSLALATFFSAGYMYKSEKPLYVVIFGLLSVVLGFAALAGGIMTDAERIMAASSMLAVFSSTVTFIRGMGKRR